MVRVGAAGGQHVVQAGLLEDLEWFVAAAMKKLLGHGGVVFCCGFVVGDGMAGGPTTATHAAPTAVPGPVQCNACIAPVAGTAG